LVCKHKKLAHHLDLIATIVVVIVVDAAEMIAEIAVEIVVDVARNNPIKYQPKGTLRSSFFFSEFLIIQ